MSTVLEPAISGPTNADGDGLDHVYCCDENRGLCGADLSDVPDNGATDESLCIVCADLEAAPCEVTCCTSP